jgi:transcriptional repressor NrdR
MEDQVMQIERALQKHPVREIPSTRIGELVMEKLKSLDDVAYVRFASVYRQFRDVEEFMTELSSMLQSQKKDKNVKQPGTRKQR